MRTLRLLLLLPLLSALFPLTAAAQFPKVLGTVPKMPETPKDTFGTVTYRAFYDYRIVKDPEAPDKAKSGTALLLIGDEALEFMDYNTYRRDTVLGDAYKYDDQDFTAAFNKALAVGSIHYDGYSVILPGKREHIFQRVLPMTGTVQYTETLPDFEWQISEETKEVAGFDCLKATLSYRGREWTAWFAEELPMPYGPYVFGGLPGMILEMVDAEGHYRFSFKGIEEPGEREYPIMLNHGETLQILPREKARVLIRNASIQPFAGASKEVVAFDADGNRVSLDQRYPYNPIELE